jgi:pimeloyl-ACP methyl ester carboxylesterase
MWRRTGRIGAGLAGLLLIAAIAGATYQWIATRRDISATAPPGRLVDVGGHRLHIWCTGRGTPAVILDSGLGGTSFGWGAVQPAVARFAQVCSYDRAGMGYSDPGPMPRTSAQIARELAVLLDRSGIRDPVVLVGASSGGWNVRLFASKYASRVAGLVLVDARHEDQTERLAAIGAPENPPWIARVAPVIAYLGIARVFGIAPGRAPESLAPPVRRFAQATRFRPTALVAAANELRHGSESEAQVRDARRELTIPVVVISAGLGLHGRVGQLVDDLQRDLVNLSTRGCRVIAERSVHAISVEQPEIVVKAIRATVDAARSTAGSGAPDCLKEDREQGQLP